MFPSGRSPEVKSSRVVVLYLGIEEAWLERRGEARGLRDEVEEDWGSASTLSMRDVEPIGRRW